MLGILLIYFIGKKFYELSDQNQRNKWLFAILGVVFYYIGTFFGGLFLAIIDELFLLGIDWDSNLSLGILALPFGLLASYLFYIILKKSWKSKSEDVDKLIESIGDNNTDKY